MNEDQFADALDGIVNGNSSTDADPLASFARWTQWQATDHLAGDRHAAIWKDLLATHPHDTPTTGGAGPLSQPALTAPTAFNPWVRRDFPPASKRTRLGVINNGFQMSITALAIVAIVIAAFAAFPIIRGDRGPEITPTAFAAAPTTSAPTTSTDTLGISATQTLIPNPTAPQILPLLDATATTESTPQATPDVRIPLPTATEIPWFPYPPVINPGPAPARPDGTPGPFTPPPIPPILSLPGETHPTAPPPTSLPRLTPAVTYYPHRLLTGARLT